MLTSLSIEQIGNDRLGHQPAWIDHVKGITPRGLIKERLQGYVDYSKANSVGSRGVIINYLLSDNEIYHVSSPKNFKHCDTYFCIVSDGEITRLTFDVMIKILQVRNRHA